MTDKLELYIHIPFCVRKCHYCDFLSGPADEAAREAYVVKLIEEIRSYRAFGTGREISSVYIGGGTPSLLSPDQTERIVKALKENFDIRNLKADRDLLGRKKKAKAGFKEKMFSRMYGVSQELLVLPATEFTVECNPGTLNKEKLKTFKKLGINRLSFGLQSASDEELKALGRIHTFRDFMDNMEEARALGFDNINVDLMSAIPGQTLASWKRTLAQIAMTAPEHISAYSLIVEPGTPFYEAYGEGNVSAGNAPAGNAPAANASAPAFCALNRAPVAPETLAYLKSLRLPNEETERQMYYDTLAVLESAGYYRYEISNYSKPGYECMHNIGYWTGKNYLGMGLGAASMVDGIRWKNTEDMAAYMSHNFGSDRYDTVAAVLENKTAEGHDTEASAAGQSRSEAPAGPEAEKSTPIHIDIEKLSHADKMAEYIILGLRLTRGFSMEQFMDRFGVSFMFKFGDIVRELDSKDLIKVTQTEYTDPVTGKDRVDTRVALTARGIDVSNTVMAEFMP